MTNKPRTGSVKGKKVSARSIISGLKISGQAGDTVLQSALEMMGRLNTGDVTGEEEVKASEDIVTGVLLDLQVSDRETFIAELKVLRQMLAELQTEPEAATDAAIAAQSLNAAITEAQRQEPQGKSVVKRLRDTLKFITDAGKALEAADKAGPLILKAIPTAAALFQVAQALF